MALFCIVKVVKIRVVATMLLPRWTESPCARDWAEVHPSHPKTQTGVQ